MLLSLRASPISYRKNPAHFQVCGADPEGKPIFKREDKRIGPGS
tara:strand:- start:36830 stop:36961 length:132 start_codon:yes stop_codon:yes gene_type:complete